MLNYKREIATRIQGAENINSFAVTGNFSVSGATATGVINIGVASRGQYFYGQMLHVLTITGQGASDTDIASVTIKGELATRDLFVNVGGYFIAAYSRMADAGTPCPFVVKYTGTAPSQARADFIVHPVIESPRPYFVGSDSTAVATTRSVSFTGRPKSCNIVLAINDVSASQSGTLTFSNGGTQQLTNGTLPSGTAWANRYGPNVLVSSEQSLTASMVWGQASTVAAILGALAYR